jgi:hypothetical protein
MKHRSRTEILQEEAEEAEKIRLLRELARIGKGELRIGDELLKVASLPVKGEPAVANGDGEPAIRFGANADCGGRFERCAL